MLISDFKYLIGDIHGNMDILSLLVEGLDGQWLQVGDFGFQTYRSIPRFKNGKAIRGNHDDPAVAADHELYMGDYGITPGGLFYVSGAQSPAFWVRRPDVIAGINYWPDEQLSTDKLSECLELYKREKPEIVVTHDCPFSLYGQMIEAVRSPHPAEMNPTALLFDSMLSIHKPKLWYFGHWHISLSLDIDGTRFRCIDINEVHNIEDDVIELGLNGLV